MSSFFEFKLKLKFFQLDGERLNLRNNENIRVIYPHRPHVSFDVSPIESTSPSNANDSAFHSNTTNINSEELLLRVNDRLNRNINYGTNSISLNIVFEERPPSYIEAMLRATSTPNDEETPQ